jgi:MFS family permease
MPRALFPALATGRFHGGSGSVGLLYAAPAMGALLGALLSGSLIRVRKQGVAVIAAIVVWGAAIVGFGLSTAMWLAVVMLAVAGAADMVSAVFRNAISQLATPDEFRGRLGGVFIAVVAGGPRLGDVEAGTVAALTSPQFSVVSGGLACIAGVLLLGALSPAFARYEPPG